MRDGENQNDQVQDLLARLRSQMSQLDEMFGIVPEASPENADSAPAVSEEPRSEAEEPRSPREESSEAEASFGAENTDVSERDALPSDGQTEMPKDGDLPASGEQPTPHATWEEPTQLDLFGELDALLSKETENTASEENIHEQHERAEETERALADEEDDTPVFSKTAVPVHIRKESIVAEVILPVDTERDAPDAVIVTEGERAPELPREQAESHASFFVPDGVPPEEETPQTALSPFSPERRFDPSRYDAMLAAYEKQKADSFLPVESADAPPAESEPPPQRAVLMPATPIALLPRAEDEEEPTEEVAEEPTEDPTEEPTEEVAEEPVEEPVEEPEEEPVDEPVEEPTEEVAEEPIEAPAEDAATSEPKRPVCTRIVLADSDLSDTNRDLRSHVSSGRIHLAPTAYRAKDERTEEQGKNASSDEEEEDFIDGLPSGIRESLVGFPLGRPNRAQGAKADKKDAPQSKTKRRPYRFPEEIESARNEAASSDYLYHHIRENLRQTRLRLIAISVFAFILLLLENVTLVEGVVPSGFVDVKTEGIIDALLLIGAAIAAWPRLHVGVKGLLHGRVLPESILFVETLAALVYAVVFGMMGAPALYLSFVPALGLAILYCFRVLHAETEESVFKKINAAGEKMILAPTAKKDMQKEMNALGKSLDGEAPLIYRVRKTSAVKGFSERFGTVCEDERLNLFILLASLAFGMACFFVAFLANDGAPATAFGAALFGCFLCAPIVTVGIHAYTTYRVDRVAGEDSAIVGEATVKEAAGVEAVVFEDIEAAPSSGVVLSGIRVHCDDPTVVFKYLTALYGHIGGPLCGRFSGMYTDKSAATALVELVDATKDGISAAIGGAELVVGNGSYMVACGISPSYDAEDERVLADGKSGVLYVAVNGMVCMKFFMEHRISAAFEKNVMRLHRLGIATILRTYDPNFNDKTLARSSALSDLRVHVVSKTVEQRNDFYAERAVGGIVTAGGSGKLLRLLLLCFRTRRQLRFAKGYKAVGALLGGAAAVALCALGVFAFVPSVYFGLYHLVLLVLYMAATAIGVKLPEISERK